MNPKRSIFSPGVALAAILSLSSGVILAADPILPWGYPGSTSTSGKTAQDTVVAVTDPKIPVQLALPSPDGHYAITWPTQAQAEKLEEKLDNILVNLKLVKPIVPIGRDKDGDYEGKRWGGLEAVWRADSRAVIVFQQGRGGPRAVWLFCFLENDETSADEITTPVRQELLEIFQAQAAKFTKGLDAEGFVAEVGCEFSADGKTVVVMARGETNAKVIEGEPHVVAELTGTFDLATRKLTARSGKVTEAKIQKNE